MIKKTSPNQPCGRDSEYIIGAFLKSFCIFKHTYAATHIGNPFKPKGIFHSYQLDQSIPFLMVIGWYFSFLFTLNYLISIGT